MSDTADTPGRRPEEPPQRGWPPAPVGWQPPIQPGVIPLRPLTLGDILGGAFATIRTRAGLMLGVTAIVVTVTQLLSLAATYPMLADLEEALVTDATVEAEDLLRVTGMTLLMLVVGLVFTIVSRVFLAGFFTVVVGTAVLGQRPTFGEVMTQVRPRLLALLGLTLVYPVVLGAAVALITAFMLTGPALGVLALLGAAVVVIWLWTLFSLATPALVLEGVGVGQAFGRSARLVRGSWWRIFGITVLVALMAGVVAFVIVLPFESLGGGYSTATTATTYLVLSTIGAIIASTLTEPFVATVTALLYTDQRMRRERLDLDLARAVQGQ